MDFSIVTWMRWLMKNQVQKILRDYLFKSNGTITAAKKGGHESRVIEFRETQN